MDGGGSPAARRPTGGSSGQRVGSRLEVGSYIASSCIEWGSRWGPRPLVRILIIIRHFQSIAFVIVTEFPRKFLPI